MSDVLVVRLSVNITPTCFTAPTGRKSPKSASGHYAIVTQQFNISAHVFYKHPCNRCIAILIHFGDLMN